ncbi:MULTISPECIES: tRNA lysidine(34) synthetase TilS [unclassified Meiothermus]|uniref:tRNA lysidine(34) synthetase TilS n=1 Tax=unclassified Meiothermus TaxID=370471 RepID=UPI000D7C5A1C|nr:MULTISPECIES: tRNA lysidine(34) synthetase TilS [unclassified Meiothermus]PZA08261.1 tRNA lysidine(34) synthetase TilS [Meiothermus sp. Pnk-1]RYM39003.1 tRNA lysidine(34) synthetase TilS [Meiothermus sp. PNK-Is4]
MFRPEAIPHPIEARFSRALAELGLRGSVVVAVSGGGDSVALLYLLKALGFEAIVAHFDHALRPSSAEEAVWVQQLAEALGYPCEVERVEVRRIAEQKKRNLEATARELRYAFLSRVAKKYRTEGILTAHTQNDQAETVLLQLLRGTGRATGIRQRQGRVMRPLLGFTRAELRDYLRARGASWLEDPTNQDLTLDRNYLRHEVLPRLEARFGGATGALARFAEVRQAEDPLLEEAAAQRLLPDRRWPVPAYRAAPLEGTAPGLRRRAIRQILERLGLHPESRLIEAVEAALAGRPQTLPGGVGVRRKGGTLFFLTTAAPPLEPGWRTPQPGDYLELPLGRKRLVEFLAERGLPAELKRVWPVRAVGSQVLEVRDLHPASLDERFMGLALSEARAAGGRGEVPIGAVLVRGGEVIARAGNRVEEFQDATAHAEQLAIRAALEALGEKVLPGSTLYVTLEPCPMCYGAMLEAQVSRLVYGAENLKAGAFTAHGLKPQLEVDAGRLEGGCAKLLKAFFAPLRLGEGCQSG